MGSGEGRSRRRTVSRLRRREHHADAGRLHITWENADTLRVDTDAGTQTRRFYFGAYAACGEPSWQGSSVARWEPGPGRGRGTARGGSLKVVTTNLKPGYVRKNGAPYSANARVTEYYDINTLPSAISGSP
jgi:hypothetical protein